VRNTYTTMDDALKDKEFSGYPNPRIIGNTFYIIGERAVYSIHAAPEIANNVFIGNVKTVGMTKHAKPFIHHNIFYRNNVSINMNRSMPVVCNNIMVNNYWGERVVEGSCPVIYNNVTWNSPYYKEFAENGSYIKYKPYPGKGEISKNPGFIDPDKGDFNCRDLSSSDGSFGLVKGTDIQQPPVVICERSWAEEFLHKSDITEKVISSVESQNALIKDLKVTYSVEYKSFMDVKYDKYGDQKSVKIGDKPVSGMNYNVYSWSLSDGKRIKSYKSELFAGSKSLSDSGTVVFDNGKLTVLSGMYVKHCKNFDDPYNIGEKMTRENFGGIYLDYDQYLNGAIGPGGTFYYGYFRILGGEVLKDTQVVDGHKCVVIMYPHIGADQLFKFYLDPEIGYKPRKLEHYFEHELYRKIDSYVYENIEGVYLPVSLKITDYGVKKPVIGKVAGVTQMKVTGIEMNGKMKKF
jgi:hypothetical protein